jgi:hypothetical protein
MPISARVFDPRKSLVSRRDFLVADHLRFLHHHQKFARPALGPLPDLTCAALRDSSSPAGYDGYSSRLSADRVAGPGGASWWSVSLVRADGGGAPVAGQPAVPWHRTREEAREGYMERLRALRATGWR